MSIREVDMILNNIDENGNEIIGHPFTKASNVLLEDEKTLQEAIESGELGGDPGPKGDSAYVHIRWGTSATPSTLLTTPNDYIGIASTNSPTAPTSYTGYSWYKYKGDKGDKGDTGATPAMATTAEALAGTNTTKAMNPARTKEAIDNAVDPVKAIYDSGSNANGAWIKFTDGTMMCRNKITGTYTNQVADGVNYAGQTFSFPQEFINTNDLVVVPFVMQQPGVYFASMGNKDTLTASQMQMRALRLASFSSISLAVGYIAIGRWK